VHVNAHAGNRLPLQTKERSFVDADTGFLYLYRVSVVDLDEKLHENIPHYFELDMNIARVFAETLMEGGGSSACVVRRHSHES